jgi:hypothetical protein
MERKHYMGGNVFSSKIYVAGIILCLFILTSGSAWAAPRDIQGHWAENTIRQWLLADLATGYPDGTFRPNNNVTRAEFITMVNRAFGLTQKTAFVNYPDVKTTDWFYGEITKAVAAGYINEYPEGQPMHPYRPITRQEVATMMAKILKLDISGAAGTLSNLDRFQDASGMETWRRPYINAIVANGYMNGYPDGTFKPTANITRAESVTGINNAASQTGKLGGTNNASTSSTIQSFKQLNPIAVKVGEKVNLPSKVEAVLITGATELLNVTWDKTVSSSEPGVEVVFGTVANTNIKPRVTVFITTDSSVPPGTGTPGGTTPGTGTGGTGGGLIPGLEPSTNYDPVGEFTSVSINYNSFFSIIEVTVTDMVTSVKVNKTKMHYEGNNTFSLAIAGLAKGQSVTITGYNITGKEIQKQTYQVK